MSSSVTYRQITYRLLPEKRSTWRRLDAMLDAQRCLYNAALEERIDCYRKTGKTLTYFDQAKSLTLCRKALPDMAAIPVAVQRGTLKRLDHAFKGFFQRVKQGGAGFPRFQGRRHFNSLSVVSGVRVEGHRLRIPGLGWLTIRRRGGNPYSQGKPVSAVLKREEGRWKAVVCHAVSLPERGDNGHVVGVDMNAGARWRPRTGRSCAWRGAGVSRPAPGAIASSWRVSAVAAGAGRRRGGVCRRPPGTWP